MFNQNGRNHDLEVRDGIEKNDGIQATTTYINEYLGQLPWRFPFLPIKISNLFTLHYIKYTMINLNFRSIRVL